MVNRKNRLVGQGRDTLTTITNNTVTESFNRQRASRGLPPGMHLRILLGTPMRLRADVMQEAWLAWLQGRNPNTAARNFVRRQLHEEASYVAVSQLSIEAQQEYQHKLY